ncbi:proto-oncogene Mas-like [Dendrobates tinctorius]|uniref:proto-oncogene Mas-like n=1 Tax=Dendrobates tinctorius TaxID=92724 RepID=UPI003CC9288D
MKIMSVIRMEENDFNETEERKVKDPSDIHFTITACCIFALCLFGLLGNGVAFWFLTFRIPRNKFTIYIINLTIADFMYLLFNATLMALQIDQFLGLHPNFPGIANFTLVLEIFYEGAYQAGMFFLLAISIERCLSVFYPLWYRCCRPKHQSLIICLIMWFVASVESCLDNIICSADAFSVGSLKCTGVQFMTFVLSIIISLPLMLISSMILLIKIRNASIRCRPPKLYITIIISVLIFLVAYVPVKFMWLLLYLKHLPNGFQSVHFFFASIMCTVLSSSINPYIYFMIGRQKKQKFRESIHTALHHVFHVEEDETEKTFGSISSVNYVS